MHGKIIKGNKSCRIPGAHIALDTETLAAPGRNPKVERHQYRLGCAVYWRREKHKITRRKEVCFLHPWEMVDWIARQLDEKRTTWLWAHSLGFGLSTCCFWDWMDDGRFSLFSPAQQILKHQGADTETVGVPRGFICLADPPVIVSGWLLGCRLVCVDTRNWFPEALEKIGSSLGLHKKVMPDASAPLKSWQEYCERDVAIVEKVANSLCDLVLDLDLGVMKTTLAGQAQQHWRHGKHKPIVQKSVNKALVKLERAALVGTRADLFFRGVVKGPIYALDVNGCHGFIMATKPLPTGCIDYTDAPIKHSPFANCYPRDCIATVTLDTKTVFPLKDAKVGTYWPIGRYSTTLCGEELDLAFRAYAISHVHKVASYSLGETCKNFSEFWYARRDKWRSEGNMLMEKLAKQMPCALYGKFAQTRNGWVGIGELPDYPRFCAGSYHDTATGLWHPMRQIAGRAEVDLSRELRSKTNERDIVWRGPYRSKEVQEARWSFPAVSAFVTMYVRRYMEELIAIAGEGHCYYLCHDCIHVDSHGYANLIAAGKVDSERQGALKLKDVYASVEYMAVNMLRINGRLCCAGLPKNFTEGEDGQLEAESFERLESILSRWPDGTVRVSKNPYTLDTDYRHGVVTESGWVTPVKLGG